MLYRNKTGFDKMKETLALEDPWTDLLINNFDRIIAFMLPFYASQSKQRQHDLAEEQNLQEIEDERKKAKMAYEFFENTLTKDVCFHCFSFTFVSS